MKLYRNTLTSKWITAFALVLLLVGASSAQNGMAKTTAIGTSKIWGTVDSVAVEGMVQGPSAQISPLQVACVFEYTEGDIFNTPRLCPLH